LREDYRGPHWRIPGYSTIVEKADGLTNIVRRADDLPDLLGVLDDAGHLQVAQLDLTVRKLAHQHDILRLKKEERLQRWKKTTANNSVTSTTDTTTSQSC
jgi:hypothetical protein